MPIDWPTDWSDGWPYDWHGGLVAGLLVVAVAAVAVVNFHDSLPLMWLLGRTSP